MITIATNGLINTLSNVKQKKVLVSHQHPACLSKSNGKHKNSPVHFRSRQYLIDDIKGHMHVCLCMAEDNFLRLSLYSQSLLYTVGAITRFYHLLGLTHFRFAICRID